MRVETEPKKATSILLRTGIHVEAEGSRHRLQSRASSGLLQVLTIYRDVKQEYAKLSYRVAVSAADGVSGCEAGSLTSCQNA